MRSIALSLAVLAPSLPAFAQSVVGQAFVDARCGGSQTVPVNGNGSMTISAHGACVSPQGVTASINDATQAWTIAVGEWLLDSDAHTDFRGTTHDAGTATAQMQLQVIASDLVFTDINNPGRTGTIGGVSFNYLRGASLSTHGFSNCSPFQPGVTVSFDVDIAGSRANGSLTYDPSAGLQQNGALTGLPGDGSLVAGVSAQSLQSLATPTQVTVITATRGIVGYCDRPPAEIGDARGFVHVMFPCGQPVFNLPPEITANSPSLGIVDNIYYGPSCCPADFNRDGFLDFFDIDAFVLAFETGDMAADYNHDGFIDFFDVDAYIADFEAGC